MRLAFALLILTAGCLKPVTHPDPGPADSGPAGPGVCQSYTAARRVGSNVTELPELSGLVASRIHPGVYWAHNDSGNALELFGIREDGSLAAHIPLTGATNTDVEDIALAPCGDRMCILLADIGDNGRVRASVALYRLPEPDVLSNDPRAVETLAFTYADGAHNTESLIVDPANGQPYILTKESGTLGAVYKIDGLAVGATGTAARIGIVNAPNGSDQVSTGADSHLLGNRILIRTYSHLWELRQQSGTFEALFAVSPVEIPSASQIQSEAVAYRADGRGYVLASEGVGEGLFRVDCRE